ncbi:MAG: hypothetical protein WBF53_08925, partial [Litorimonas sp.]
MNRPRMNRPGSLACALLLGGAALLSGCATLTDRVDAGALIDARSADIPVDWQVGTDPIRAAGFAALYTDPVLARYLALAAGGNFDLEQARLRIERADAQVALAQSRRRLRLDSSA